MTEYNSENSATDTNFLYKVETAINEIKNGKMIVLYDDIDRENEGDLIVAGDFVTQEKITYIRNKCMSNISVPISRKIAKRFGLFKLDEVSKYKSSDKYKTPFSISFDSKFNIKTGVSSQDIAQSISVITNPFCDYKDITTPGHINPLIAEDNGVFSRLGHTDCSIDLMKLSGCSHVACLAEMVGFDGNSMSLIQLENFCKDETITLLTVNDVLNYRKYKDILVKQESEAKFQTIYGNFIIKNFKNLIDNSEILVLITENYKCGDLLNLRVHSKCFTGDLFKSMRCDCGWQLDYAMQEIQSKTGAIIYLDQEGRGIGMKNKLKAYKLQDCGIDTVEANHMLGLPADNREYWVVSHILRYLNINAVNLITNNPSKINGLKMSGTEVVSHERIIPKINECNFNYIKTKKEKMHHLIDVL